MNVSDICAGIEPHARLMTRWLAHEVAVIWPLTVAGAASPALLRSGTASRVLLEPADVFGAAMRARAQAVVLVHNHLQDGGPSKEDLQVTRRLVAAGALLGIPVMAHLVLEPSWTHELVSGRLAPACACPDIGRRQSRPAGPLKLLEVLSAALPRMALWTLPTRAR